jgi:hypothetical protein
MPMVKPLDGPAWLSGASSDAVIGRILRACSTIRTNIRAPMRRAILLFWAAVACDVRGQSTPLEHEVPLACETDRDCSVGRCLMEFGICSRPSGQMTTLLFEITPQASDPVYGGARFLKEVMIDGTDTSNSWLELNVRPRVPVSGSVLAAPDQLDCLPFAQRTLPATLTFTPRQRLLGLSVPSYELLTAFDDVNTVYRFEGSLPPGSYDVYMSPDIAKLGENCRAIPQIFRDFLIGGSSDLAPLVLAQPSPASLRLTIEWDDSLEGWMLDMVHPMTGEIISNRVRLSAEAVVSGRTSLETILHYSRADNGEELVRLTPPAGRAAGTVLLVRSGLELLTPGEGLIGNVSNFGSPVRFQSWVWKEDEPDLPVPGTVSFAALDLDDVDEGVLAAFGDSATVDSQGKVSLDLLPGRYRIRVTPPGVEVVDLGFLAGFESTVTVWPPNAGAAANQAGHVIEVPAAITLEGQVVTEHGNRAIGGVLVQANASDPGRDYCLQSPEGDPAASCEPPRAGVLQKARAQDPFIPRTRSGLSRSDGGFSIGGLDCGRCEPGAAARFDLSVRPHPNTGLPWLVRPSIDIYSNHREPLRIPTPVALPMRLTYGGETSGETQPSNPLPGALVRVYAFVDNRSSAVVDLEGLVPCVSVAIPDGGPCLQSLLQLAEVRSDSAGELLLLLPPRLP